MQKIELTGLGACEEVGRSSFLLDFGPKLLLDRGIKLNADLIEYPLPVKTNIDAMILSHAHLDHSGDLPHLFLTGNPITFLTLETLELSELLWLDTLKIARIEGIDANFSKDEIVAAQRFSFPVQYNKILEIIKGVDLELLQAGHILGAAISKIYFKNKALLYTGDFRVEGSRLMPKADLGKETVDYVITEATYGDREHKPRKEEEKKFVQAIRETIENNGVALIPSFAVGRSEEIIELLFKSKINVPVYLDGMGQKAAKISLHHQDKLSDPKSHGKALKAANWIKKEKDRVNALKEPCAIVTTAGMLAGGPAMFYMKKLYKDRLSSILFTGYQVEGTPGRKLLDEGIMQFPENEVKADLNIHSFDFSGHASQSEMLYALNKWNPEKVILVHGDKEVMPVFKKKIEQDLGLQVLIPSFGEKIQIDVLK